MLPSTHIETNSWLSCSRSDTGRYTQSCSCNSLPVDGTSVNIVEAASGLACRWFSWFSNLHYICGSEMLLLFLLMGGTGWTEIAGMIWSDPDFSCFTSLTRSVCYHVQEAKKSSTSWIFQIDISNICLGIVVLQPCDTVDFMKSLNVAK